MIKFKYRVIDKNKKIMEGVTLGQTKTLAIEYLHSRDYVILELSSDITISRDKNRGDQKSRTNLTNKVRRKSLFSKNKISAREKQLFFEQLAVLLDAGISVVKSLELIAESIQGKYFHDVLVNIKKEIAGGLSLSESLGLYPKSFDSSMMGLILAGEQSGTLVMTCNKVSQSLEQRDDVKQKIIKALIYPIVLMVFTMCTLVLFFLKIIPAFMTMFSSFNSELPQLTRLLVGTSEIFSKYFVLGIIIIVASIFFIKNALKIFRVRKRVDQMLLKIPVLGGLMKDGNLFDISLLMSIFLKNGIAMDEALELIKGSLSNLYVKSFLDQIRETIISGESLSSQVRDCVIFPNTFVQMVKIGEETGQLVDMLERLSQMYYKKTFRQVDIFVSLFEPFALLVVGAILGFLVVAMYLPIFSMASSATSM